MTYKTYQTKTILNIHKHCDGGWFWNKYSAFPYIGCEWGCEYCYCRDEKYNPHKASRDTEVFKFDDPFSEYIKIKENAPEILRKELKNKPLDLIYLDNYQPVDAKYKYARGMLEVCYELKFPVFINEKSSMFLSDLDILKEINKKSYINVGWSIITAEDNEIRNMFEPKAPSVASRFLGMKKLAENNILTGTVFMPILPFIYDDEKNIEAVIKKTKEYKGRYVLDAGLTLWGHSKTYFYKILEKYNPELIIKYDKLYSDSKSLSEYAAHVHQLVLKYCKKYRLLDYIPRPVDFYPDELKINKKIASEFYLKARELQMSSQNGYKEWAYKKGALVLDELNENIEKIYKKDGINGIMKIKGIGKSLATQIQEFLKRI